MDSFNAAWAPRALFALRVMTGLVFLFHGPQKLLGFPEVSARGMPDMATLPWFAGVLELVGGPLIVLGLFTRPAAFILSGFMAVAYFMAHAPQNFYPLLNGGELAILYCFIFLYLAAAGPGAWSLDEIVGRDGARQDARMS